LLGSITASFTRTVTKWTLKCDSTGAKATRTIVSYFWNWGDGTNNTITNGTAIAFHTYATASTVTVGLTMTDVDGAQDSVTYSVVIVGNTVPTASFTTAILAYTVTGTSTSIDSDGTVVKYEWNWGDNTTFDTTANPSHTYALAGTYTITLKVTD
jgi:PKD repeat protein